MIDKIVAPLGLRVDESSPWVYARLSDGSRVQTQFLGTPFPHFGAQPSRHLSTLWGLGGRDWPRSARRGRLPQRSRKGRHH